MKNIDVLVVEDEALLLSAIVRKLELEQISVVGSPTSSQALNYLETEYMPKVLWLDYYLPDSTGLDFTKKIKADSRWQDVQIIVVSNSASIDKVQEMREAGVKYFFEKSDHRLDEIVTVVKSLL